MHTLHACAVVVIIGTKLHYTLDVALAIFLTVTIWQVYHNAIRHNGIKQRMLFLPWLEAEEVMKIDDAAYSKFQESGAIKTFLLPDSGPESENEEVS